MLKAIAFGLSAGVGFQALRNYPADGPVSAAGLAVAFVIGVGCAFLGGLARRRRSASAWASAHAEATAEASASSTAQQQVNVINVLPGGGAGNSAGRVPAETAPWVLDSGSRSLELDNLDGLDLAELLEVHETDHDPA